MSAPSVPFSPADLGVDATVIASSSAPHTTITRDLVQRLFTLNKDGSDPFTPDDQVSLYGSNRPTNPSQLVGHLNDKHINEMAALIALPGIDGSSDVEDKRKALIALMEKSKILVAKLQRNGGPAPAYNLPSIDVNPNVGLNLLLANPYIAAVVMEKRKRDTELAKARITPVNSGILGLPFLPPTGLSVFLGPRVGGGEPQLNPLYPVEMRGAGRIIAEMRGGNGSWVVGTNMSPTSFRPLSDQSFISNSLEIALNNLTQTLKQKNSDLDDSTKNRITGLVAELRAKEEEVKKNRDQLNKMSQILGSQNTSVGTKVGDVEIQRTVEAYNQSNTSRQKLENKLFRVIIALGNQVKTFP